jgi:hypothetical protein
MPLIPTQRPLKKEQKITSGDKDAKKLEPSYFAAGSIKWTIHCGGKISSSSKVKHKIII